MSVRAQAAAGLALAGGILAAWALVLSFALFAEARWIRAAAPGLVLLICWLDVGLFIVAHDAMHGSLAPGRPRLNAAVGGLALACYAGFAYRRLKAKHGAHHRHPGTVDDPDFHAGDGGFWPWYGTFLRRYFGLRELAVLSLILGAVLLLLHAPLARLLLFWALPAILSSLQLFLFGTWLPHRPGRSPFADAHRARSSGYGSLASLLTCFHFGYHHEHHRAPHLPWWRLPGERRRTTSPR
ncbi:MAG TPA: fatty acid desaturase [Allosphingosinicella sp.]|nr:fatty acid desaturase [Allosphingosinicella sp.]